MLFPYLILHESLDNASDGPNHAPATLRQLLTHRLWQVEQGQFKLLLQDAISYERAAAVRASEATVRQRTKTERQQAASVRADDGCLRSAAHLLLGDAVLPRTSETADKVEALYRSQPHQTTPSARGGAVRTVNGRTIAKRLRHIRGSAHPGPGGERNAHLRSLLASPHCLPTLTRWVNCWLRPEVSAAFRNPWLTSGLVPLDKGEGKPRPVVFQESLLKLVTGSVVDTSADELRLAAGSWQHGIYHQGGAIQMVWDLRCAMYESPDDVFTGIDCRNAFGEAARAPAMRAAQQHCPQFARLLHNLWDGTQQNVHIPDGPGSTRAVAVRDGFVQGGCEAAPAFGLCLRVAVDKFLKEAAQMCRAARVLAYMDDLYLQCSVTDWPVLMKSLRNCLASVGLHLRPDKSNAYIPSADPAWITSHQGDFCEHANLRADGLPTLGTAADGQFSTQLGPAADPCKASRERLQKAEQLCSELRDLCSAPIAAKRRHPAWKLLSGVVNHSLTYDASVNPPGAVTPLGRHLDDTVEATACAILGVQDLSRAAVSQLRLGRQAGGCDLISMTDRCYTAYLAAALRIAPAWATDTALQPLLPGVREAQHALWELGIALDQHAMPYETSRPPQILFDPDVHLQRFLPKRQRKWWEKLDNLRAAELAQRSADDATRLRSCGGVEGGAFLLATQSEGGSNLADAIFSTAVLFRLGLPVMRPCACQHSTVQHGKARRVCLQAADGHGHHAVTCKVGGAPYAAHSQGCNVLHAGAQQAGWQARREQIVPELASQECMSPQLDIEGWGLLGQQRLLVDFTLRHPLAARYSATCDPMQIAEEEKAKQYPPKQGLHVHAAALEVYGRHSDGLRALLEQFADFARQRERAMGMSPTRWLKRWRTQLSCIAAVMVGRSVQQAAHSPMPAG